MITIIPNEDKSPEYAWEFLHRDLMRQLPDGQRRNQRYCTTLETRVSDHYVSTKINDDKSITVSTDLKGVESIIEKYGKIKN